MKKTSLVSSLLLSILLSASCSSDKSQKEDVETKLNPIETTQNNFNNDKQGTNSVNTSKVDAALNSIQNSSTINEADVAVIISYMEENATDFFKELASYMPMINQALKGVEPTEEESNAFTDFVNKNQKYFECIGFAIGADGQLSAESQKRLDKLAERNSQGFENVGIILGLAMQIDPEVATALDGVLDE